MLEHLSKSTLQQLIDSDAIEQIEAVLGSLRNVPFDHLHFCHFAERK